MCQQVWYWPPGILTEWGPLASSEVRTWQGGGRGNWGEVLRISRRKAAHCPPRQRPDSFSAWPRVTSCLRMSLTCLFSMHPLKLRLISTSFRKSPQSHLPASWFLPLTSCTACVASLSVHSEALWPFLLCPGHRHFLENTHCVLVLFPTPAFNTV